MANLTSNGITIEYEVLGSGPPLLLVMGLGGQLTDWPQGFVDQLAERFTVIRFDNRDIGLSTKSDWTPPARSAALRQRFSRKDADVGYFLADMAEDAVGLLDGLNISKAHVVGMSMGGMIAQSMAIAHPDRVLSLTSVMSTTGNAKVGGIDPKLIVPFVRRPTPTPETAIDESVWIFQRVAGPLWDEAVHRESQAASLERSFSPDGTARQLAAIMASPDRTADLEQLDVPTLVIHGLADRLVLPSGGIATVKAIPGARLLMLPDMGHDIPKPRWNEMVEAITTNTERAPAAVQTMRA